MSENIERLEDLGTELMQEVFNAQSGIDISYPPYWAVLATLGIITKDSTKVSLTPRGAELVADYKRRHDSAASMVVTIEDEYNQANLIHDVEENPLKPILHQWKTQALEMAKEVETMQAEIARLQAENATLAAALQNILNITRTPMTDSHDINQLYDEEGAIGQLAIKALKASK